MSIPPLVCSTPPPPDQCEDFKDPEDFDLPYNLSQDDEDCGDNAYGYGNFSYSNYQTSNTNTNEIKVKDLPTPIHNEASEDTVEMKLHIDHNLPSNNISSDVTKTKLKCEDDLNIEDLNLELDEELGKNNNFNSDQSDPNETSTGSLKVCETTETSLQPKEVNAESICPDPNVVEGCRIDEEIVDVNKITSNSIVEDILFSEVPDDKASGDVTEFTIGLNVELIHDVEKPSEFSEQLGSTTDLTVPDNFNKNDIDDEFGDFEDFQLANNNKQVSSIVNSCDNPWESEKANDSEFDAFTANFEETEFQAFSSESKAAVDQESKIAESNIDDDDNDDFGDFDDFKSSSLKTETPASVVEHSDSCEDVPVLNLHTTENEQQIMDSISKVLTSIFVEEMTEPVSDFEGTLESSLSETWGHLMQTDERQPYIVHWNNSLGQKTLLKSLCIDSRNILFGPKWNTNMPKYAATLMTAPLQPLKPLASSSSCQSETSIEKTSSKQTTWSDPFTSDGQESCNTETQSSSINTTGATDLDVFEAAMAPKPDKIYSSTLNVQPLRQINLPDTHIFTPTDSETPRSKTIHYDSSPTVLLPQPSKHEGKTKTDQILNTHSVSDVVENNTEDGNEYWEFQGFQSNPSTSRSQDSELPVSSESNFEVKQPGLPTPSVPFQMQPLQPIKVEPTVPTLNWPEPGEVKNAFDDFSDFVSVTQNIEKESVAFDLPVFQAEINDNTKTENIADLKAKIESEKKETNVPSVQEFDDDFDTFKSAVPSKQTNEIDFSTLTTANPTVDNIADFEYAFPNSSTVKSETISFPKRPSVALTESLGHNNISNTIENTGKNTVSSGSILPTNLLQPTPAYSSSNTSKQKTGQILQPLSLESYSQINWPSPGIDLQDLSRFNPVETLQSLKSDLSVGGLSKGSSPVHNQKSNTNQSTDDDVWGEFVSSKPQPSLPKKQPVFVEDDEWTDFISSPSVTPQNGLNTISLNVHTNSNIHKTVMQSKLSKNHTPLDIPSLNYITPKAGNAKSFNDRHFQNL